MSESLGPFSNPPRNGKSFLRRWLTELALASGKTVEIHSEAGIVTLYPKPKESAETTKPPEDRS